jgi:Chaperone of endosialidase
MTANYDLPSVVEKRVRFFDGQFLQDQDFVDEQKYHLDRERRHLRMLHVAGIADGLAVSASASEPNKVTVAPGTAIDSDGRQLALAEARTVDLPAGTFNDKQGVELYISYQESAEDVQTTKGSSDFTRWLERPKLEAVAPGGAYAGATPPVLLARVALDSAGRVTVDDTVRAYSGLRLPGAAADAPTLRSTAGGQVALTGSLTVDGNLGVGTPPSARLSVAQSGATAITGTAQSAVVRVSAGALGEDQGSEVALSSTGLTVTNNMSLGVRAIRTEKGKDWYTTALGLGMDVDNTVRAGAALFLHANRNVGIGTTTPPERLSVAGDMQVGRVKLLAEKRTGEDGAFSTITCNGRLHITGDEILWLLNKNGVIVSKNWGGNGDLTVEGTFHNLSDARLKQRIRRLERPLDRLTAVRGVSYLPRQAGGRADRSEERPAIGVLAQEVEAVFPQLVSTIEGHGYKAVNYNGLTAVLLEAVKELKTALDALQARVAALQAHA